MVGSRAATGARWFVGALAGALVLVVAPTAAGSASATSDATVTLWLDPSDGPPGTKVIATAWGYDDCHAPGATRSGAGGGVVQIFWEGLDEEVGSAVVPASGVVEVPFTVPADASAQKYSIVARCTTDSKLTDDDLFVVTGSEKPAVIPPTATPGTASPPSVTPSSVVPSEKVTPATAAPRLVRVPRVLGLKVAEATAKVSALGLVLRVTPGKGDIIASQSPTAGSMVGVGHAVRITTKPAVVALPPIPVSKPVGVSQPVVEQATPARSAEPFPWLRAGLLALVVLAFGAVTYRVARRRLDERWARNKLKVVVPPAPAVDPKITEYETAPPTPLADAGIHIHKGD
ncbi:PASTA domain-containing protein [Kribbella sp. NPDC026596]|uniref:PASTA domain-containing protein n=1 Tax=Kribbella sp. NPDC026596 TaxID=3155122 RepID=UPI0033D6DF14